MLSTYGKPKHSRAHQLEEELSDQYDTEKDSDESVITCITDICTVDQSTEPLFAEMSIENTKRHVTFQIDCGATVNMIYIKVW